MGLAWQQPVDFHFEVVEGVFGEASSGIGSLLLSSSDLGSVPDRVVQINQTGPGIRLVQIPNHRECLAEKIPILSPFVSVVERGILDSDQELRNTLQLLQEPILLGFSGDADCVGEADNRGDRRDGGRDSTDGKRPVCCGKGGANECRQSNSYCHSHVPLSRKLPPDATS